MSTILPPRRDFDVSEQVYEFFRSLTSKTKNIDKNSVDDQISMLIGFFDKLNKELININDIVNDSEIQTAKNLAIIKSLDLNEIVLNTNNSINAKIRKLEELLSLVPEESELSLFKAFKSLEIKTYTYSGTMTTLTKNITVSELIGQSECFIEVNTAGASIQSTLVTSDITSSTNILLTRQDATNNINYILKVKDHING